MNVGTAVLVPGARDVRATLDTANERASADAVVVACPPHPQHRGTRSDSRLTPVSAALGEREIDCLRFDYGPWDEGRGECRDVRNACRWAIERYDSVGLFGYSFGATIALLAVWDATAEDAPEVPSAVSVLAPDRIVEAGHGADRDALRALDRIERPLQVVYGERDATVTWEPIVSCARERDLAVEALSADHFFVGQSRKAAARVASFLGSALR